MEHVRITRQSDLDWRPANNARYLYKLNVPKLHVLPG